ncbi:MAG: hypothetical protein PVSMB1_03720 [Gemmatimonadaceae bacterium]
MGAAHQRLDHALAFVDLAAWGYVHDDMAGVPGKSGPGGLPVFRAEHLFRATQMSLDGFTDEIS